MSVPQIHHSNDRASDYFVEGGRGGHHGLSRPAEEPGAATSYDQVGG